MNKLIIKSKLANDRNIKPIKAKVKFSKKKKKKAN